MAIGPVSVLQGTDASGCNGDCVWRDGCVPDGDSFSFLAELINQIKAATFWPEISKKWHSYIFFIHDRTDYCPLQKQLLYFAQLAGLLSIKDLKWGSM